MMEIGSMIKQMDLEYMYTLMVLVMKVTGKMIFKMEMGKRAGQMVLFTKVIIFKVKNMVKVFTVGAMGVNMMETGLKTK